MLTPPRDEQEARMLADCATALGHVWKEMG